jgi:formamidopyrimidine-DNA glycosylase
MPELPEVETARRGIAPHLLNRRVANVLVRDRRLRWPVPASLVKSLPGRTIRAVERRAKYILLRTDGGTVILHLGMSGSLRVVACSTPPGKWDHVDIALTNGNCLRLRDPRRFGALLWTTADPARHKLLRDLGPEPFSGDFDAAYLYKATRGRRVAIRDLLLNTRIVAGIGNIYANETLFAAGIRPQRAAGRVPRAQCELLVTAIRATLDQAIAAGGTTLRDFQNADGRPGYFQQTLNVYGRAGEPRRRCRTRIRGLNSASARPSTAPGAKLDTSVISAFDGNSF